MNFVLDSSVVLKWYIHEVLTDQAMRLKDHLESQSQYVAVPEFFFVESANILWKKAFLKKELLRNDAKGIYSRVLDLSFHVIEDEKMLLHALDLALDHAVSVYDGLYLACSVYTKAILVTADSALVRRLEGSTLRKSVMFLAEFVI